jgi:hypothetical protein
MPPETDPEIRARKEVAGRVGFVLGCIAAAAAAIINLSHAPRPWTTSIVLLAVHMAALNNPLGNPFGLLGEKLSRRRAAPPRD